jgi:hypothetical protein
MDKEEYSKIMSLFEEITVIEETAVEMIYQELKRDCVTYGDLEIKLQNLERNSRWGGEHLKFARCYELLEALMAKEKSGLEIVSRPE